MHRSKVLGGPALAAWLDVLAFALDVGYVFPDSGLFGVGIGVNF